MEILDTVVFGDYTLKQLLPFIIVVIVLMLYGPKLWRSIFGKSENEDLWVFVHCDECGWEGKVGKYNKVCRSCSSKVLREIKK